MNGPSKYPKNIKQKVNDIENRDKCQRSVKGIISSKIKANISYHRVMDQPLLLHQERT